jgi:hypothetical protein
MKLNDFADRQVRKKKIASTPAMACMIFAMIAPVPAHARSSGVCMQSAELEAALIDWYQEQPAEVTGHDIVLWKSQGGETWTLVKYRSDGVACALKNGTDWHGFQSLARFDEYISKAQ